ncbi:MAG: hypothetical protein RJB36_1725, partial [Bacteroidota bacterium]
RVEKDVAEQGKAEPSTNEIEIAS